MLSMYSSLYIPYVPVAGSSCVLMTVVSWKYRLFVSSFSGIVPSGSTRTSLWYRPGSSGANTSMTITAKSTGSTCGSGGPPEYVPSMLPPTQSTTPLLWAHVKLCRLPVGAPVGPAGVSVAERNTEPVGSTSRTTMPVASWVPWLVTVIVYRRVPLRATGSGVSVFDTVRSTPVRTSVVVVSVLFDSTFSGMVLIGSTVTVLVMGPMADDTGELGLVCGAISCSVIVSMSPWMLLELAPRTCGITHVTTWAASAEQLVAPPVSMGLAVKPSKNTPSGSGSRTSTLLAL